MQAKILRPKSAAAYLGIARSTLYRWEKSGDFPPRLKLGPQAVGWRKSDLDAWLDRQAAESR